MDEMRNRGRYLVQYFCQCFAGTDELAYCGQNISSICRHSSFHLAFCCQSFSSFVSYNGWRNESVENILSKLKTAKNKNKKKLRFILVCIEMNESQARIIRCWQELLQLSNRSFYSCVLSCQAFDLEWGWRWPCSDKDQYIVGMITEWFTFEKQQCLYDNKVTLSHTSNQRLDNQACNCKTDYCNHDQF